MASIQKKEDTTVSATPWRDNPELLEDLYWEYELSLSEIASSFGCHKCTVRKWAHRHEIQLRPPNDQKRHPSIWTNESGYTYADSSIDGDRGVVAIHELVAISTGADPHEVFSPETQVHHRLGVPGCFDTPKLDIPGNVTVMGAHEHQRRHQEGTHEHYTVEDIVGESA